MVLQISQRVTACFKMNSMEFQVFQRAYMQSWVQSKKVKYSCLYSGETVSGFLKHQAMNTYESVKV